MLDGCWDVKFMEDEATPTFRDEVSRRDDSRLRNTGPIQVATVLVLGLRRLRVELVARAAAWRALRALHTSEGAAGTDAQLVALAHAFEQVKQVRVALEF